MKLSHFKSSDGRCLARLGLACSLAILLGGCQNDGFDRQPVRGTVKVNGQPLKFGGVTFVPIGDTKDRKAAATIVEGKFSIPRDEGPIPGSWRVEIHAPPLPGGKLPEDEQARLNLWASGAEAIPAAYNTKSTLQVEVKKARSSAENSFDFNLTVTR